MDQDKRESGREKDTKKEREREKEKELIPLME